MQTCRFTALRRGHGDVRPPHPLVLLLAASFSPLAAADPAVTVEGWSVSRLAMVPNASHLDYAADGSLYVGNRGAGTAVSVVLPDGTTASFATPGGNARSVWVDDEGLFAEAGSILLSGHSSSPTTPFVKVYDPAGTLLETYTATGASTFLSMTVNVWGRLVAGISSGSPVRLYSSTDGSTTLSAFATLSGTAGVNDVEAAPDGRLYVARRNASSVTAYDEASDGTLTSLGTVSFGSGSFPIALALDADEVAGGYLYVAVESTTTSSLRITRIDPDTLVAETFINGFSGAPQGVAVSPEGCVGFSDFSGVVWEACPDEVDTDGDGVLDEDDNCPDDVNADQADTDGDLAGDACDTDDDGDGVEDGDDNCAVDVNSDQSDLDGDGEGDACDADDDGDAVVDSADNCPTDANSDQSDLDGDGEGDACDADDDGDAVVDSADNCPSDANADQADTDADGTGDACDPVDDSDDDADDDGVSDADDVCPAEPAQTYDLLADGCPDETCDVYEWLNSLGRTDLRGLGAYALKALALGACLAEEHGLSRIAAFQLTLLAKAANRLRGVSVSNAAADLLIGAIGQLLDA